MMRFVFGEFLFFLLPFAAYVGYLLLRQRNPTQWDHWSAHVSKLAIAGVVCVIVALLFTGLTAPREKGEWVAPHMENGKLIPGYYK